MRRAIQCERLTHTLNMTLRDTQNIGAEEKLFSGALEGEEGGRGGVDPPRGGGCLLTFVVFYCVSVQGPDVRGGRAPGSQSQGRRVGQAHP